MFLRCKNGTDLLFHCAKFAETGASLAAMRRKSSMFFFVCYYICDDDFNIKTLEYRNSFDVFKSLCRGSFMVVHPPSTPPAENVEVENMVKFRVFRPLRAIK